MAKIELIEQFLFSVNLSERWLMKNDSYIKMNDDSLKMIHWKCLMKDVNGVADVSMKDEK